MNLTVLKEIEIWQQFYQFNYNCFSANIELLYELEKFLKTQNISKSIKEINEFYDNGALYNKTNVELAEWSIQKLGIDYNVLLPNFKQLTFNTSHGKNKKFMELEPFNIEFNNYIISMMEFLKKSQLMIPDISKINLYPLKYSFIQLNDCSPISSTKTITDYLSSIEDGSFQNLSVITKIGKTTLSMPLFYSVILRSYTEYHDNHSKDPYTDLFFNEVHSLYMQSSKHKIAS